MGKGTIISEKGFGSYNIELVYAGRDRVNGWIADLDTKIAALGAEIAGMPEGLEKDIANLRLASLNNRRKYLQTRMPDDLEVNEVWCADYTTGLTGNVGIIEVPGEHRAFSAVGLNIQPGHDNNAIYDETRDGQLLPAVATSPEAAYFNRAILPGWQKWKPTYRYGTIVVDSIDFDNDTCDVCLSPAYSSQLNLDVNQNQGFSDCEDSVPVGFNQFCADNPTHPT